MSINHRVSLKTLILLPLGLVLLILLGMFHYGLYRHEKQGTEEDFQHDVQAVQVYYQRALLRREEKLGAALEVIRRDERLQAALRARNHDALRQRAEPLYSQLHDQYGITHFYFDDPRRVNVLRVHQPGRFGDAIDRFTTLAAARTGKTSAGVELGSMGTFTLRAVAPVRDAQGLAGYVELGEEIEEVLRGIRAIIGTDHILLIDKQFLAREAWEDGMNMLKRSADWERLSDVVIIYQTLGLSDGNLKRILSREANPGRPMELLEGGKRYYAGSIPLKDVGGRHVGTLLVLSDKTQSIAKIHAMLRSLSIFYLALGGALFAMFYLITRRVQWRLDTSRELIVSQGQEREALQAQHILELEAERDKLRLAQEDLHLADQVFENSIEGIIITDPDANILRVNRAFTTITSYGEEEVLGRNPRLLRSDHHDAAFFREMWGALVEYGYWQGEVWNRRKTGEIYPQWLSLIAIRNEQDKTIHYLGIFADLSEKKQAEAHLHHLAYYDALTELPNRMQLEERLKQALGVASAHNSLVAVLHLDLDRFKAINDTLGHAFGDRVLQAVAERLAGTIRGSDALARFSGDEFAMLLADVGSQENAGVVARKILETLARPFELEGHEIFITPSIGIAFYPLDAGNPDDLLKDADSATSHAKLQGGNCYHFYSAEMNAVVSQRLSLETSLRHALEREEFVLYYQPQIGLADNRIIGMEALLRWQHPERGLVSPMEFIPLLEETGLIVPVGEWVLRTACAQTRAWQEAGLPQMRVAVNLSAHQFRQSDLTNIVCQALEESGLAPEDLELEVTESVMIQDLQATITTLHQLHVIGIQISIDDFGTGYSSLAYLKRLPISKIKIDQSFVRDICSDPDDAAIADAVISLGHSLKLLVIAEGVETQEQLDYLRGHGCDEVQGYHFSRPLSAEAFAALVVSHQASAM